MRLSLCFCLLCGITAGLSLHAAEDKPLKVFILIGQSNMVGKRCQAEALPAHLAAAQEQVQYYNRSSKKWEAIKPGITEKKGFGPELSFGYALQKEMKEPIGIIKLSVGGSSLYKAWNPKDKQSLYAQTLNTYRAAAKLRPITAAGLVWVQGGADAKQKEHADAYAEHLKQFITAWRRDLKQPALPVVCGRCGTSPTPDVFRKKKPFIDTVRSAQGELNDPWYTCVDLDDISTTPDNVHFDTGGMLETGHRYAREMHLLLNKQQEKQTTH